jgi:hypothetical protein
MKRNLLGGNPDVEGARSVFCSQEFFLMASGAASSASEKERAPLDRILILFVNHICSE